MYNVGFIPARAGSKGVKNKNIKNVNNKPLIYWTTMVCQKSNLDKVYISTDSEDIKKTVLSFGFDKVEVIGRSEYSASDKATSETALIEFCENYNFDNVVFLQATSPLTSSKDINGALVKYQNSEKKSLISVVRRFQFIWNIDGNPVNYNPKDRPRRQDWEGYYVENGAFYISSREEILKSMCRITPPVDYWEMSDKTLFEVDNQSDIDIIEKIFE